MKELALTRMLIVLLLLGLIVGCSSNQISDTVESNIIKSPNDVRQYQTITLANKLQILLISDETLESSGASMTVGVGSFQNPKALPGLAHYLEHMLFLGTEKYPEPNSFQKFVENNAGMSNAYTTSEQTNYFYQASSSVLDESLARFSDYFKAPTFDREYSNKERNAVNSEWSSGRREDGRIIQRIRGLTANKGHPLQKISVGNLETLKNSSNVNLYSEMLDFYERYYSANNMKLVVFGKKNLKELALLVESHFADIENKEIKQPKNTQLGLTKEAQGLHLYYKPKNPYKSLIIEFPILNNQDQWKAKPNHYIANLLSSEEPNTVAEVLRKKGWIDYFTASASPKFYGPDGFFSIRIGLTEKGLPYENEIIAAVFNYIQLIKEKGIDETYYYENKAMLEKSFVDMQTPKPLTQAIHYSGLLFDIPAKYIIAAPYYYNEFNVGAINKILDNMIPQKARIWHINEEAGSKVKTSATKVPFYEGKYSVEKITELDVTKWSQFTQDFSLPAENDLFSSNKAAVVPSQYKAPEQVVNKPGVEAWLMHSQYHQSEMGYLQVVFNTQVAHENVNQWVISNLVSRMFSLQTTALQDKAGRAGIGVGITQPNDNHTISLAGYSEKHSVLYSRMLKRWVNFNATPQELSVAREGFIDRQESLKKAAPHRQLFMQLNNHVKLPNWSHQEIMRAAKNITMVDVEHYFKRMLQSNRVRIFAYGNYAEKTVKKLARITEEALGEHWQPQERYFTRFITPKSNERIDFTDNVEHTDNAYLQAYYAVEPTLDRAAQIALLNAVFHNAFYSKLRTEEQLGYIVGSSYDRMGDYWGFLLYAQSTNTSLEALKKRFGSFVEHYIDELEALDEDVLKQLKTSVIAQLNQVPGNFSEEYPRYLSDFYRGNDKFDSKEKLISAISRTSKMSIIEMFKSMVLNNQGQNVQIQLRGTAWLNTPFAK